MAKKPEKIMISIREELDTYSSIDIAEIAEKYKDYPDARIVFDCYYETCDMYVEYRRLETDEEFADRLAREELSRQFERNRKAKKRETALKEFLKLKKEYGFE